MQRILVVEDNSEVRAFVRDQLRSAGFYVEEAENGQTGFQTAKASLPDLIISDVVMPVMDGFTLSRQLRSEMETSHIPILMLTARSAENDKLEGLESGIDAYITKPFSSKELMAQVNNLIRQRRLLRDRFKTSMVIKPSEVSVVPMDQLFLEKVLKTIEEHMGDSNFGVETLSSQVHISVNHLHRKLTALINQSPGNLIRTMRLQRAAELLCKQAGTVAEIAYEVGFNVPENFSKSFKKHFGVSPSEYSQ